MESAAGESLQAEACAVSAKQISLACGTLLLQLLRIKPSRVVRIDPPQLLLCSLLMKRSGFQPFNLSV